MFDQNALREMLFAAPVILFALTVHEYFHAWTALKFGDPTARDMGRLTLNPIAHIDLIGLLVMFMTQFRFGWAKPVPVNPLNLRNYRVADSWIAAAGPLSNVGLAVIFAILYRLFEYSTFGIPTDVHETLIRFLLLSVWINIALALFNMLPLFPLDGSHILRNISPPKYGPLFDQLQMISPFVLLGLVIFGAVGYIIGPVHAVFMAILIGS